MMKFLERYNGTNKQVYLFFALSIIRIWIYLGAIFTLSWVASSKPIDQFNISLLETFSFGSWLSCLVGLIIIFFGTNAISLSIIIGRRSQYPETTSIVYKSLWHSGIILLALGIVSTIYNIVTLI